MKVDGALDQLVAENKMHLLMPLKLDDSEYDKFKTDVGKVFLFLKYADNAEELMKHLDKDDMFSHEALRFINAATNAKFEIDEENYEEEVSMCKAIETIKENAIREAKPGIINQEKPGILKEAAPIFVERGRLLMLQDLIDQGIISIERACKAASLTEDEFKQKIAKIEEDLGKGIAAPEVDVSHFTALA